MNCEHVCVKGNIRKCESKPSYVPEFSSARPPPHHYLELSWRLGHCKNNRVPSECQFTTGIKVPFSVFTALKFTVTGFGSSARHFEKHLGHGVTYHATRLLCWLKVTFIIADVWWGKMGGSSFRAYRWQKPTSAKQSAWYIITGLYFIISSSAG